MDVKPYEAFWSYAHEDNERQGGRLLALAGLIEDEFSVVTGDDLALFLDRQSIEWGQLWRERIDQALGEAPFFIAIITPKYVRSVECRRELLSFISEAESRGISRLLLPILFIDVPDLTETSHDEVLAMVARTQYVDWRELRLLSPSDPKVLQAVNLLARRMQHLREEAQAALKKREQRDEAVAFETVSDIVDEIDNKFGAWMDAVEYDHVAKQVWVATVNDRIQRLQRLSNARQRGGPTLAVYKRLGIDLLPIATNRLEKAQTYSRLTIELNPLVTSVVRYASENPALADIVDRLNDGVQEAVLNIEPPAGEPQWSSIPRSFMQYSQHLQQAVALMDSSTRYVREGNDIVLDWRDKLRALKSGGGDSVSEPQAVVNGHTSIDTVEPTT